MFKRNQNIFLNWIFGSLTQIHNMCNNIFYKSKEHWKIFYAFQTNILLNVQKSKWFPFISLYNVNSESLLLIDLQSIYFCVICECVDILSLFLCVLYGLIRWSTYHNATNSKTFYSFQQRWRFPISCKS